MDVLEPEKLLKAHLCPFTGRPCGSPSLAECSHFWQCIRQALADRRDATAVSARVSQLNRAVRHDTPDQRPKQSA